MNITKYLTPKIDVTYLQADCNTDQALSIMKKCGFQTVPVIDKDGCYVGTMSEGDFMWTFINEYHKNLEAMEHKTIGSYRRRRDYTAVSIDATIDDLRTYIIDQNFVPVVDARNVFIGIITRKAVISELIRQKKEREQTEQ